VCWLAQVCHVCGRLEPPLDAADRCRDCANEDDTDDRRETQVEVTAAEDPDVSTDA
jgi:hypothetical protein